MKIIKHRLAPRRPFVTPIDTKNVPSSSHNNHLDAPVAANAPPRKKALLIGINYLPARRGIIQHAKDRLTREKESGVLLGPHNDVKEMSELLQAKYGYAEKDVVVMIDDGVNKGLQPTRENIMREIRKFVEDARSGDHFFFLYSGHTDQLENKNNTEEDGMDECLVPVDAKGKGTEQLMIRDDELKRHLVEALPVGSQLVAIFDSCHSASLLDLDHFRCNRVYVPWRSKGRRKSDSVWNANVRRGAMDAKTTHVYRTRRVSSSVVRAQKTSISVVSPRSPRDNKENAGANNNNNNNNGEWLPRQYTRTKRMSMRVAENTLPPVSPDAEVHSPLSITLCDSPVAMYPCDGWCARHLDEGRYDKEVANVIALAACKDSQLSWETGTGASMTKVLVEILKTDPHPTLSTLLARVSHNLHDAALNLHSSAKQYKKAVKAYRKKGGKKKIPASDGLDMDNFQDPQFSSHKPLDMQKVWEP